jgi:hypothetical protein
LNARKVFAWGCFVVVLAAPLVMFAAWKLFWAWTAATLESQRASRQASCDTYAERFNHGPVLADGYRTSFLYMDRYSWNNALDDLVGKRFRYVDIDWTRVSSRDRREAVGAGRTYVRYRLAERGDAACAAYDELFAKNWPLRADARDLGLPDALCIAKQAVDSSPARFAFEASEPVLEKGAKHVWHQIDLEDLRERKVVARYRSFYVMGSSRTGLIFGCFDTSAHEQLRRRTLLPSGSDESLDGFGVAADSPVRSFYRKGPPADVDARSHPIPTTVDVEPHLVERYSGVGIPAARAPREIQSLWDSSRVEDRKCGTECLRLRLPAGNFLVPSPGLASGATVVFLQLDDEGVHVLNAARSGSIVINSYALDGRITGSVRATLPDTCGPPDDAPIHFRALESRDDNFLVSLAQIERGKTVAVCDFEVPKPESKD